MRTHKKCEVRKDFTALSLAKRVWEALDTPVALSCYILAENGEFEQLVRKSVEASNYVHPFPFFLDYQAVKLLAKYPDLDTGIDRQRVAEKKFIEAEVLCRSTNERFSERWFGHSSGNCCSDVDAVLFRAQRKIANILGDVPELEDLEFRFGPGAAYGVRGETSVYNKVESALECTFAMLGSVGEFLAEFPSWVREDTATVLPVQGSQLTFVPKDAKTDRPICIEPLLNGLYQKGFGSYIRSRLRSFGIRLKDQGVNQKLASVAHDRGLATIDFSSASDTIAYNLVQDLLPQPWFEALDVARCPRFEHEHRWYNFEKFSSMGNAYTFELETLIFFALASASCEECKIPYEIGTTLHVYGDDVIIPRGAFDLFAKVSSYCGFILNKEKSYASGCFYESCGHDYFNGRFVRPFFLKKKISKVEDTFYVANQVLQTIAKAEGLLTDAPCCCRSDVVIARLHDVHAWCISRIPRRLRLLVPLGQGDCGLHSDFDVAKPTRGRESATWFGWNYRGVRQQPIKYSPKGDGFPMAYAVYFAGAGTWQSGFECPDPCDNGSGYTIRNRTTSRVSTMFLNGHWPRLQTPWRSRALDLVSTGRNVTRTAA